MAPTTRAVKDTLVPVVLAIAVLYFGRGFFIPLALAILISFLLAPLVMRLERWKLGRIAAVIIVTLFAFGVIGGIGTIVGGQLIDLANELPKYRSNLREKVLALKTPKGGALEKATQTFKDLTNELSSEAPIPVPDGQEGPPKPAQLGSAPDGRTVQVAVIQSSQNAFETLASFIAPLLGPLGTAALVILFVIFILLEREDLRDRVIHLIGHGHLHTTTQALDEAAYRVSRYLLAQLIVNVSYGIPIGVGLYFIGVPNAFLWGLLATVLRFIPYLGPWIAASFPIALSLAVSSSWSMPLQVLGLFIVIEVISNNVVEPWLYGASTGLSPMAVIVAAAFWTWLWGTLGLLLATPLTVCIAVLGKYLPQFTFLDVLLGDKPPIAPEDRFYQRLLATDEDEVCTIAEDFRERNTLAETFDRLIIPAMRLADEDFHNGNLSEAARNRIYEIVRDLVNDLAPDATADGVLAPEPDVEPIAVCVPASDYADELVGMMLAQLLLPTGQRLLIAPSKLLASEMLDFVEKASTRLFCVSVLPPGSTRHAIYVARRLRDRFPEVRLLIGMWAEPPGDDHRLKRFQQVKTDGIFTSLQDMAKEILATGRVAPAGTTPV